MSQKKVKQIRRQVKKAKITIQKKMIEEIGKLPFRKRIKIAILIIRGFRKK